MTNSINLKEFIESISYNKSQTYNREEVLEEISKFPLIEIVRGNISDYNTSNAKNNKIYIEINNRNISRNKYNIYIYVDNEWEMIDSLEFDIGEYYTGNHVDTLLEGKSDVGHGHENVTPSANNVNGVDGFMSFEDKDKLDTVEYYANHIDVDENLSTTSTNPVQNKLVTTALNGKAPTNHKSTATTYGVSDASNYGHSKASNTTPVDISIDNASIGTDNGVYARGDHTHKHPQYTAKTNGLYNITVDKAGHISNATLTTGTDLPSHTHPSSQVTDTTTYSNIGNSSTDQASINSAINTKIGLKANSSDVYTKSQTMTSTEIGQAIADGVANLELIEIVNTLPTTNIKNNKIYLKPNNENPSINENIYDLYIRVNNQWEQIDSLEFNINDYYTKTQADNLLNGKVNTTDSRLTDARTPTTHTHNSNDVTGLDSNKNVITDNNGSLATEEKNNHNHGSLASGGTLNSDTNSVNKVAVTDSNNNLKTISNLPSTKLTEGTAFATIGSSAGDTQHQVNEKINTKLGNIITGGVDLSGTHTHTVDQITDLEYTPATANPKHDEYNGAVGTSTKYAREDHKHPVINSSCAYGNTSDWYLKIMTITVTGTYMDRPLAFDLLARRPRLQHIELSFVNANNTDPQVRKFIASGGDSRFWIVKSETSTWDIYVRKQETNDTVYITNLQYANNFTITYPNTVHSTLPTTNILEALYERDNIGVNLFKGTKSFTDVYEYKESTGQYSATVQSELYNGCVVKKFDYDTSKYQEFRWTIPKEWLETGGVYTFSFWAKSDTAHSFVKTFFWNGINSKRLKSNGVIGQWGEASSYGDGGTQFYVSHGWTRYFVTYQLNSTGTSADKNFAIRLHACSNNVYVAGVKFEKGDQATKYSESPFDAKTTPNQSLSTDSSGNITTEAKNNHSHGNITSSGTITTTDSSNFTYFAGVGATNNNVYKASKLKSDQIIDTTAHTNITSSANDSQATINTKIDTALSGKADSSHTHSDTELTWNGATTSNSVSPLLMATAEEFNANRLAYFPPSNIIIETSTDGGSTWTTQTTSTINENQRTRLVTLQAGAIYNGNNSTTNYSKNQLRITFDMGNVGADSVLYMITRKIALYTATSNATGFKAQLSTQTYAQYSTNQNTFTNVGSAFTLDGWSGWNTAPINVTLGGNASQTGSSSDRIKRLRITLSQTGGTGNGYVSKIRLYGETAYRHPSQLATNSHMYTCDESKNVTFPANVNASKFVKDSSSTNLLLANGNDLAQSTFSTSGHAHAYSEITSKPSYTPTVTSSTTGAYKMGSINISGSSVDIYGKDTNTTYTASSTEPKSDYYNGGVVGTSTDYARADHRHTRLFSWSTGGVSTATHVNLMEIKVTTSWNDKPITFTLQKRAVATPTYVSIKLPNTDISSANYSTSDISFKAWGDTSTSLYLRQTANNTWNLIAYKVANDSYHITDLYSGNSGVTFTGLNTNYGTTAPSNTTANPVKTPTYLAGATPYGTSANTVAQGNHTHNYAPANHNQATSTITSPNISFGQFIDATYGTQNMYVGGNQDSINEVFATFLSQYYDPTFTFNSNVTWENKSYVVFYRIGNICFCEYWLASNGSVSTNEITIGTIPANFRPSDTKYQDMPNWTNEKPIRLKWSSGGEFVIHMKSSGVVNVIGTMTYLIGVNAYSNFND